MNFEDIVGHERPISILKRALAHDALAHAYLFSGESGIGKKLTAVALASALNCHAPGPGGSCGVCPACRKTAASTHPDVRFLYADGDEIKIDQIRQAQADLSLRPFEGRKKILIVDEAERMNDASANAFLKTLEEPPGDSLIILVSSMPQSLLPTIRSRCQEIKFQPLPRKTLAAVLKAKQGLSDHDARFLAALSRGSLGRALSTDMEQEKALRDELPALWSSLPGMGGDEVLSRAEAMAKDRDGFERLLDAGVEWLRDIMVYQETGDDGLLVHAGENERIRAGAEGFSLARILGDLELFTQSRSLLERRVSAQLVAENLLLKLGRG
jgi:DNA polymerase-3 subunit delta'